MPIRSGLFLLVLGAALAACSASTSDETPADGDESSDALVTQASRSLVGSYRIDAPNSAIRGLVVKDPSRNYEFEKTVMFELDVDPSQFPGLCHSPLSPGEICMEARVEGSLKVKGTILSLTPNKPANPLLHDLFGSYRFTHAANALKLSKVSAPNTTYDFAEASYCTSEYDCAIVTPDSMCHVEYKCSDAQRSCSVVHSDPTCDTSFSSVADLSDIGGTWKATGPSASSALFQSLVLTSTTHNDHQSSGTFIGSSPGVPDRSGQFSSMPENPAIGFASITLGPSPGAMSEIMMVGGVKLDAQRKVTAMTVALLPQARPVGPPVSWVYERQP